MQRSSGAEKKLMTAMPGTAGERRVDGFGQLGSGLSRRPAHGGDDDHFGERRTRLGRPAAESRGGEHGSYSDAWWHGTVSSHPR
jgi:hypothetical protein